MSAKDEVDTWVKSIKGVVCFPSKLKVYAPTCHGKCILNVEELISKINDLFGGSTVYDAEGTWLSDKKLEKEPLKVIEVGHNCTDKDVAEKFGDAIKTYAEKADQKAISISAGEFYIASTPDIIKSFKESKVTLP